MIKNGVKTLVLYLEEWQKRMVKDFLGVDCDTYTVQVEKPVTTKYGIPTHEESKRMYFTDWQMREMRDLMGHSCEFIELHKSNIKPLYAAPTH
jgi:hypothetical protein